MLVKKILLARTSLKTFSETVKKVPYDNDEIIKSVTKHNKSIPTCSTDTASSTKEEINNSDQIVPTIKLRQRNKLIIMEIFVKYLVYRAHHTISTNI